MDKPLRAIIVMGVADGFAEFYQRGFKRERAQ